MSADRDENHYDYDVIVVGAGVAGASAVHHLLQDDLCFPMSASPSSSKTTARPTKDFIRILVVDAGPAPGEGCDGRKSGSATMKHGPISKIKMMTQVFACDSSEFVKHHGMDGARQYMQATKAGIQFQKDIAKLLEQGTGSDNGILSELGSYYVCPPHQKEELKAEYEFFRSLGSCCEDVEFVDGETRTMQDVPGASPDFPYAIHFPKDAVIDSSEYAKRLLAAAVVQKGVTMRCDAQVARILVSSKIAEEESEKDPVPRAHASIVLEGSGETLSARYGVVVATGAMDPLLPELHGLIQPCYSYLAHVPVEYPDAASVVEESPNFFTWGYSHDWCFTQGKVRVSGEDHFSAYKDPHVKERCGRMIVWTRKRYHCSPIDHSGIPQQHGIYSETPDHVPLVGTLWEGSPVCYLLGCNAWGQAILSYCATLVPGLLGFGKVLATQGQNEFCSLDESQREILKLLSIRRYSEHPELRKKRSLNLRLAANSNCKL